MIQPCIAEYENNGKENMLRIDIHSSKWMAALHCAGRLTYGVEIETLRTMVQSRTEATIHVHLSGVDSIDAAGLGLLVELHEWAASTRRTLTFMDLSEAVWRMVILTKLCATLDIASSDWNSRPGEDEANEQSELIA